MHLANHGSRNIGNAALILGLERTLSEDLDRRIAFQPEPWDEYSRGVRRFDERFVERVNAECDALLVGAAVSFDGSATYTSTGFRFDLPLPLWDRLERPVVFYGLSHRAWPRKPFHGRELLVAALERMVASSRVLFSVRNDGTKDWLEALLGHRSERIHTVPDPALFVPARDAVHPELVRGARNVVIALNAEDEPYRWGAGSSRRPRLPTRTRPLPVSSRWMWREARDRFLAELARALEALAGEHELNLVFCCHEPHDIALAFALFDRLPPGLQLRSAFASAGLTNEQGPYVYDLYAKADLALAMRVHSITPAVGLGTPVVPLVSQDRVAAFLADAALGDLGVDVRAPNVRERVLRAAARALAEPDAARARLQEATRALRERTAAFNHRVDAFVAQNG
jgi:hypothetical protein